MSGQVQPLDEQRHRIQDGKQTEGDEVAAMVPMHGDGDASGSIQTVREGGAPEQKRRKCTTPYVGSGQVPRRGSFSAANGDDFRRLSRQCFEPRRTSTQKTRRVISGLTRGEASAKSLGYGRFRIPP